MLDELYDREVSLMSGNFGFEPIPTIWLDEDLKPEHGFANPIEGFEDLVA